MGAFSRIYCSIGLLLLACVGTTRGETIASVHFPASTNSSELQVAVTFHLWIPPALRHVRGIIVHQHGCGDGAENSGETAALDLHWRELALRHDCAILSPHYQAKGANCRNWCDPRSGSDAIFLRALDELASDTGHPELASVPWCLWGHSGGGYWVSLMLEKHPERIVAIYCRSGAATTAWLGELPTVKYSTEAYNVPIILNPGIKERGDKQFNGAWEATSQFFEMFRAKGAPVAFAPDPFSSHDCRNSRLLAIPFFDDCLRLRLPRSGIGLKTIPISKGVLADWQAGTASPASLTGTNALSWLPDQLSAIAYAQYVKTGITRDITPPRTGPVIAFATRGESASQVNMEWTAEADFESGIKQFAIYRDGQLLAKYPEDPKSNSGFPQFQTISYHDTPVPGALAMRFTDTSAPTDKAVTYTISTINGAGLESPKSKPVKVARVK
jgi:pimeloyl-ACP methyl ester carboxylesterase